MKRSSVPNSPAVVLGSAGSLQPVWGWLSFFTRLEWYAFFCFTEAIVDCQIRSAAVQLGTANLACSVESIFFTRLDWNAPVAAMSFSKGSCQTRKTLIFLVRNVELQLATRNGYTLLDKCVCKQDAKRRTRMPTKIQCFVGMPIGHPTRKLKTLKKHYKNSMNRSEMLPGRLVHEYSVWGNASKSSTFIIFIVRARSPTDNILYVC